MDVTFLRTEDGNCGFCGKHQLRATRTLVRSSFVDVRICDECLAVCANIFAQQAGIAEDDIERQSAFDIPDSQLDLIGKAMDANVQREVESGFRRPLGRQPRSASVEEFRCSFCDRGRHEVATLVSGPRTFICNECVVAAIAFFKRELR